MIKRLTPKALKELARIQASIPKELTEKLIKKENPNIEMLRVLQKIVKDPEASKAQRYKANLMLDAGFFSGFVEVVDKKIEKQIDDYIDNEIQLCAKRGTLPKGKKFRNLKKKIKNG